MDREQVIHFVKSQLVNKGFSGLYYPGECGCGLDDLAPCGEHRVGEGEGAYMNGCRPGYQHNDPRPGREGDYVVTADPQPPAPRGDAFDEFYD